MLDALAKKHGYCRCEVEIYKNGNCYLNFTSPDASTIGGIEFASIALFDANGQSRLFAIDLARDHNDVFCKDIINWITPGYPMQSRDLPMHIDNKVKTACLERMIDYARFLSIGYRKIGGNGQSKAIAWKVRDPLEKIMIDLELASLLDKKERRPHEV